MFLPYLAVPVGGVLMMLNLTFFILRLVKRRGREGGSGRSHDPLDCLPSFSFS